MQVNKQIYKTIIQITYEEFKLIVLHNNCINKKRLKYIYTMNLL